MATLHPVGMFEADARDQTTPIKFRGLMQNLNSRGVVPPPKYGSHHFHFLFLFFSSPSHSFLVSPPFSLSRPAVVTPPSAAFVPLLPSLPPSLLLYPSLCSPDDAHTQRVG